MPPEGPAGGDGPGDDDREPPGDGPGPADDAPESPDDGSEPPGGPTDPGDEPPAAADGPTPSGGDGPDGDGTGSGGDAAVEPEISEEEQQELLQEIENRRTLTGLPTVFVSLVALLFSVFQVLLAARGFILSVPVPFVGSVEIASLQLLQANAIHVTFALVIAFFLFPPSTGDGAVARRLGRVVPRLDDRLGADHPATRAAEGVRGAVRWLLVDPDYRRVTPADLLLVGLAVVAGAYFITDFTEIRRMRALGMGSGRTIAEVYPFLEPLTSAFVALGVPLDTASYAFVLGVIGVLLVLEATRRALGVYLMMIVASFIVYAKYGFLIPQDAPFVGVLSIIDLGWDVIIQNLWYNTENGVFGIPVTVSVQFIYIFILFGAFLEMSGAGQWFIDLAYAATGRRKGGPAKASILASGFMGTISGSSIANTVTTGAFTIPLMKRSGYRAEFAGAVEASASSGGQILPPVMGAAAFLIVEYTGTPYADVIVAAAVPATVFFFGVWVMVHLEANRAGIGGLSEEDIVDVRSHMRRGWFYLVPLVLLLWYLIGERLSVARSAWFTLVALTALIALVAVYNRRTRWPLVGAIVALSLAEVASFATFGVGLTNVTVATGEPMGLEAAANATVGRLGWIILAVCVTGLVLWPREPSPMLAYDPAVDETVGDVTARAGRPGLADNDAVRFGGFVLKALDSGARTATTVVIAVAAAGIIPGVVSATGLGPNLTALLIDLSGGTLVVLLVFTAIASIILGMGMPTTVTYIILVAMLAPAMLRLGIPLLVSHLFILYFGVIADITPPVAVAAYAASGIAKSDQFDTGVLAFSLSLNKAIVPFAFVFAPGILLLNVSNGEASVLAPADLLNVAFFVPEVAVPVVGVFVGVIALGATVIGFLYTGVDRTERAGFALSALLLMAPRLVLEPVAEVVGMGAAPGAFDLLLRGLGGVLFALLVVWNRREAGREPATDVDTDVA